MRSRKGSLELSHAQDYPLLRQVMHCWFVTHDLLLRHHLPAVAGAFIYSISSLGALRLQGLGEYYCGPARGLRKIDEVSCFHSVELNDVHLALARRNL